MDDHTPGAYPVTGEVVADEACDLRHWVFDQARGDAEECDFYVVAVPKGTLRRWHVRLHENVPFRTTRTHPSRDHSHRVVLEWDGEWWVVSDEHGEFARATDKRQALRYAEDLMHGPSTKGKWWSGGFGGPAELLRPY